MACAWSRDGGDAGGADSGLRVWASDSNRPEVQIPALFLTSCVNVDKLPSLTPHICKMGIKIPIRIVKMKWENTYKVLSTKC